MSFDNYQSSLDFGKKEELGSSEEEEYTPFIQPPENNSYLPPFETFPNSGVLNSHPTGNLHPYSPYNNNPGLQYSNLPQSMPPNANQLQFSHLPPLSSLDYSNPTPPNFFPGIVPPPSRSTSRKIFKTAPKKTPAKLTNQITPPTLNFHFMINENGESKSKAANNSIASDSSEEDSSSEDDSIANNSIASDSSEEDSSSEDDSANNSIANNSIASDSSEEDSSSEDELPKRKKRKYNEVPKVFQEKKKLPPLKKSARVLRKENVVRKIFEKKKSPPVAVKSVASTPIQNNSFDDEINF